MPTSTQPSLRWCIYRCGTGAQFLTVTFYLLLSGSCEVNMDSESELKRLLQVRERESVWVGQDNIGVDNT